MYVCCTPQVRQAAPSRVCQAQGSWAAVVAGPLAGLLQVVAVLQASMAKVQMVSLGPPPAWVVRAAAAAQMAAARMVLGPAVVLVV
jgi:hypothetical protein